MRRILCALVAATAAFFVPASHASLDDPDGSMTSPCAPGISYGTYATPTRIYVIRCSDGATWWYPR